MRNVPRFFSPGLMRGGGGPVFFGARLGFVFGAIPRGGVRENCHETTVSPSERDAIALKLPYSVWVTETETPAGMAKCFEATVVPFSASSWTRLNLLRSWL